MSTTVNQQIDEIVAWMQDSPLDRPQIGARFVTLNRILTSAQPADEQQWPAAAHATEQFLVALERELQKDTTAWSKPDLAKVFSILLTIMAEAGQYRHEQSRPSAADAERQRWALLDEMGRLRQKAIHVAQVYLARPEFRPLHRAIEQEIHPLLDSMDPAVNPDRFMPFRVIQVGNIAERLYKFHLRTDDPYLTGEDGDAGLLREIYDRKYLRFGTSGVRGRWGLDFTEARAKQVVQAICDYLNCVDVPGHVEAEDLRGMRVVIGYDSRRHAERVAQWVAEVCIANGFQVDLAYRETPTPALVFYATDHLQDREGVAVAGLINCTASHNPPEWQGIKFNPRLGYPASTTVTDFIAARANELQLLDQGAPAGDLDAAEAEDLLHGFDPITHYTEWVLDSGKEDDRIPLDWERMREYFAGHIVVVDEMYGAGRGYLPRLLGEIGVRHTVIHGERNPNLPGLEYANPEEPFLGDLKERVQETHAVLGLGLDTDADRFGIVDRGGLFFRPNQILPMLVRYLRVDRGLKGRVIATQTGSPLIEVLAGMVPAGREKDENRENEPLPEVLPAYVSHPFYRLRVGQSDDRVQEHTFLVPVGIKYIEEQRRTDRAYKALKSLPEDWRDTLLIGGEESSGLTTRGHVTDKDGIWADLLVMDMLAYYGTHGTREGKKLHSIAAIWEDTTSLPGCWVSYGGVEREGPNSGREDVDAVLEAKDGLLDFYLDFFTDEETSAKKSLPGLEGLETRRDPVRPGGDTTTGFPGRPSLPAHSRVWNRANQPYICGKQRPRGCQAAHPVCPGHP